MKVTALFLSRFLHMFGLLGGVLSVLVLTACGGGGGGGGSSPTSLQPEPGLYSATITVAGETETQDNVPFLLSPSGRFASLVEPNDITVGILQFDGAAGSVSGTGTNKFQTTDGTWQSAEGDITGTVIGNDFFQFTTTAISTGFSADVELTREPTLSDLGLTMTRLSGDYSSPPSDAGTTTFIIGSNGDLTGNDSSCILTGQVVIPDPAYNIFETTFTAESCDDGPNATSLQRNGDYEALGFFVEQPDQDVLVMFGINQTVTVLFFTDSSVLQ